MLALTSAIIYLFLAATFFIGGNLVQIKAGPDQVFGQPEVQFLLVVPLLAAGTLATFLFPISLLGIDLGLAFLLAAALHLILAAAVAFGGGAPLSYLKSHHRTARYESFAEFWNQRPKCFAHVKAIFALLGFGFIVLLAALFGAAWSVAANLIMALLWSYGPSHGWELALVIGPPLALIGPLITLLVVVGLLGRSFSDARREWLSRLAAWMGLYAVVWLLFVGFSLFGHAVVVWLSAHAKTKAASLRGLARYHAGGLARRQESEHDR